MRHPIYLELSEYNVYRFPWPVSQQFWPDNKRRYIKISLETRHPKEALRLAKGLSSIVSL
jgi:hypothetical protein